MFFIAARSFDFNAFLSCTMVTEVSISFGFKFLNCEAFLNGFHVIDLNDERNTASIKEI